MIGFNYDYVRTINVNGHFFGKIPFVSDSFDFNTGKAFENSTVPVGLLGYQQVITDNTEFKNNLVVLSGSPLSGEHSISSTIKNLLPFGNSLSRKAYSFASHTTYGLRISKLTDALWFKVNFGSTSSSNQVYIWLKDPTRKDGKNNIVLLQVRMVGNYHVLDFLKSWNGDNQYDTVRTIELANSLSDGNSHIAYIYFKMDSGNEINSSNIYYGFVRDDGVSQHYSYDLNSVGIKPYRSPFLVEIYGYGTNNMNYPNELIIWNYSKFNELAFTTQEAKSSGGGVNSLM